MTRIPTIIAGVATCLAAACGKPASDLLREAHRAALPLSDVPSSAEFDDGVTQVFPEKGLVCGSKVKFRNGSGEYDGYQRFYFSRTGGAALEGVSASWMPLANACIAAMEQRIVEANHRLGVERAGT
jgi:hypothetical protein